MEIRPATIHDAQSIAPLIYSAGPEIYDFINKTSKYNAQQFIEFEFRTGQGFCGYRNVTVAVQDGQVVATGCFFDGPQHKSLTLGTIINLFRFYGPINVWPVLARAMHTESVMKRPRPGEIYLSNFGVSPQCRGQGIGTTMIQHKLKEAKRNGYTLFGLDVASTNPRAENLYQRLGLSVVKQKQFSGKREGHSVPDSRKMELDLSKV